LRTFAATNEQELSMTDGLAVQIRMHQANLDRYIAQLETAAPSERREIERLIEEERAAIEALTATGFSVFPGPHSLL
jgi:hypothetical protein